MNGGPGLTQVVVIAALCCVGHICMVVVVACCCCIPYRLALMLAQPFAPCVLTFVPYILAQIVHLHTWCYHPLQLALMVLFQSATGANTALAPGQLALCGDGQWWWYNIINSQASWRLLRIHVQYPHTL